MAYQTIYKDIGIADETDWGSSIACTTNRIHIVSTSLAHESTKELVDDTMTSPKGNERSVYTKNVDTGDITGYVSPRTIHQMLELAMGVRGTSTAMGTSGAMQTYTQNVGGSMISKTINIDRNNSQETWNGVRASALEITGSDKFVEFTLNAIAKTYSTNGTSMQDLMGETVKAAPFSDVTVTIHHGATYGTQFTTLPVSEWSVKYENGLEATYLSGSRNIVRTDPKVPTVTGKFKIFHEGMSFVELAKGCSEGYLRFNILWSSCAGLIAGVSPYQLRIDVPRVDLTSDVRSYKAAEYCIEDVEFVGKLNTGTSSLIDIALTAGNQIAVS